MIDREDDIIRIVENAVHAVYPDIVVYNEYINRPASFPAVFVTVADSYEPERYIDSSGREKFTTLTVYVEVFTNDVVGRKKKAKDIFDLADTALHRLGFRRETITDLPSMNNATVYRRLGMYECVATDKYFLTR